MGRLKTLPSRLLKLAPLIGHAEGDAQAIDRDRDVRNSARGWYRTKRWATLRQDVFVRDGYVCQRSGVLCIGKYPSPNSPVANHKRPHRGDPRLFWDINNIETVAKSVHDGLIQSEEQAVPTGVWS